MGEVRLPAERDDDHAERVGGASPGTGSRGKAQRRCGVRAGHYLPVGHINPPDRHIHMPPIRHIGIPGGRWVMVLPERKLRS